jgi:hypothetical protein
MSTECRWSWLSPQQLEAKADGHMDGGDFVLVCICTCPVNPKVEIGFEAANHTRRTVVVNRASGNQDSAEPLDRVVADAAGLSEPQV